MTDVPHFRVPLSLPHAGRVARRILMLLHREGRGGTAAGETAAALVELLEPCYEADDNPPGPEAARVRDAAAGLGRRLVDEVELDAIGGDRLGQGVRNLFECLELGREGALISLRAGEDPRSLQRPR